jgi:hypothetical protein
VAPLKPFSTYKILFYIQEAPSEQNPTRDAVVVQKGWCAFQIVAKGDLAGSSYGAVAILTDVTINRMPLWGE